MNHIFALFPKSFLVIPTKLDRNIAWSKRQLIREYYLKWPWFGEMAAILKVEKLQFCTFSGFGMGTLPPSRATIRCGTYPGVIFNDKSLMALLAIDIVYSKGIGIQILILISQDIECKISNIHYVANYARRFLLRAELVMVVFFQEKCDTFDHQSL